MIWNRNRNPGFGRNSSVNHIPGTARVSHSAQGGPQVLNIPVACQEIPLVREKVLVVVPKDLSIGALEIIIAPTRPGLVDPTTDPKYEIKILKSEEFRRLNLELKDLGVSVSASRYYWPCKLLEYGSD